MLISTSALETPILEYVPDAFEMHRAYLHDLAVLFTLQQAITTASCHVGYVKQLRSIDVAIVLYSVSQISRIV